jgi:hypothetical protein
MTHADWLYFAKFIVAAFVIFYLNVWFWESRLAGSWRVGHAKLWKKPKRWQLVTFCVLWDLILIAFIVAFSIRRSNRIMRPPHESGGPRPVPILCPAMSERKGASEQVVHNY